MNILQEPTQKDEPLHKMSLISVDETKKNVLRIQYPFLDGLRGLAALQVVCFHFIGLHTSVLPRLLRYALFFTTFGHFSVNIFIVLSGFCLMLPVARTVNGELRGGTVAYLRRRAWRILPPYYIALAMSLTGLLLWPYPLRNQDWLNNFDVVNILSHLFLVHNFTHNRSTINVAFWSIATEWQIYFIFPALLLPIWRRFGLWQSIGVGILVGILPQFLLPNNNDINGACPWYIGLFALGMAGAVLTSSPAFVEKSWVKHLPYALIFSLFCYGITKVLQPAEFSTHLFNIEWLKDLCVGFATLCFIMWSAYLSQRATSSPPMMLRLLESHWILTLGLFSYSLYLTHGIVLNELNMGLTVFHLSPLAEFLFRVVVGLPVAITFAYLFYLGIEKRFISSSANQRQNAELHKSNTKTI